MAKTRNIWIAMVATLASLGIISLWSGFRSAVPETLAQATYFSPLHLVTAWWKSDPEALINFRTLTLKRNGLSGHPMLAVWITGHCALMLYFLRKL